MTDGKPRTSAWPHLLSGFERHGQRLAPRYVFAKRLAVNVGMALGLIGVSLLIGMLGYQYFEGLDVKRSFGHAAMILGGMGPYSEPGHENSEVFEGLYALYSGLVLVGVTGLILAPVFHRVMHQFHLPDEEDPDPDPKSKPPAAARRGSSKK